MSDALHHITLAQEADTTALAARIAPLLRAGDTLLLNGPIGAGKSAFARAVIRARLGQRTDVPSPTFTIVQTYDDADVAIWHCDLYRITDPEEGFELGLEEAFDTAICLIEWPERLGDGLPDDALHLTFAALNVGHEVTLQIPADWKPRLAGIL